MIALCHLLVRQSDGGQLHLHLTLVRITLDNFFVLFLAFLCERLMRLAQIGQRFLLGMRQLDQIIDILLREMGQAPEW